MTNLIRREMIALLGAGLALPSLDEAKASPSAGAPRLTGLPGGISPRHLWIAQSGGGDELHARIRTPDGIMDRTGVRALRWLFRDWRDSDAVVRVDVRLFELLAGLQSSLTAIHDRPLRITLNSGYRTRARNARIEGAAPNSQHTHGKAADFTLAGVKPSAVAEAADMLGAPGLGRYPSFTHVDVGPEGRRW
ncbi:MAG: YcbK family protein [Paracoccaceae bacterium]